MNPVALCVALAMVTVAMAVVAGINDGGILLALAVRYPVVPLAWFVGIVCATLVAAPLVLGQAVARTLQTGLFENQGSRSSVTFLIGVSAALVVVWALSRWGLPTSLTLALVGGLSGAALGSGLGVDWGIVGRVLVIGVAAPTIGFVASWLAGQLTRVRAARHGRTTAFRWIHLAAFGFQCVAYSVNDGQKMLAVAAVAIAALPGSRALLSGDGGWLLMGVLAGLTVLFCIGMLSSVQTVTSRIASGLAVLRPVDAISAELVSGAVVLASTAVGAPVSMTQSVAAGVVGAAGSKGMRRVRWDSAVRIATAWLVTLPASGLVCFTVALLTR